MNHRDVVIKYTLHQYEFRMISQQYLSGDSFSYTNGAYEFSVEFCVVKFSCFGQRFDGLWNKQWQKP